jgi:hypothetical protein
MLLVVTGARCPLTKPAVTAVEQQATTEPYYVVQREPAPGVPGCQLPLFDYEHISARWACRTDLLACVQPAHRLFKNLDPSGDGAHRAS